MTLEYKLILKKRSTSILNTKGKLFDQFVQINHTLLLHPMGNSVSTSSIGKSGNTCRTTYGFTL